MSIIDPTHHDSHPSRRSVALPGHPPSGHVISHVHPAHRLPQSAGDISEDLFEREHRWVSRRSLETSEKTEGTHLGVVVVGGSLNNSLGSLDRITGGELRNPKKQTSQSPALNSTTSRNTVCGTHDPRPDEDAVTPQLHHQRGVCRGSDPPCGEHDDWQSLESGGLLEQVVRRLDVLSAQEEERVSTPDRASETGEEKISPAYLGISVKFLLTQQTRLPDLRGDGPDMFDGLDDVPTAGLSLASDERGTLGDPAESFP